MMESEEIKIIIISDGTGETASLMTKAAVVQFSDREIAYTRYKNIRTQVQIEAIFEDAANRHDLVVYTLVSPSLRKFTQEMVEKYSVPANAKPLQSVGYAEAVACLQGSLSKEKLAEEITRNTRRLAKSQMTWFNGEELSQPLRPDHRHHLFAALGLS